jgi:hypothetical protein
MTYADSNKFNTAKGCLFTFFYMIEVRWEILEEEGRVIKAICDLTRLSCRFVPKSEDKQR